MTPWDDRARLREAIRLVRAHALADSILAPFLDWQLQTSNSFRRIGQRGDGDVLCATKHPIDGHPDLFAAPGVLEYVVAAQPRVVAALLDDLDAAADELRQAKLCCDQFRPAEDIFEQGHWRSCSGCHELDEGHPTGPYNDVLRCNVGSGCHECGGIGAIWEHVDDLNPQLTP